MVDTMYFEGNQFMVEHRHAMMDEDLDCELNNHFRSRTCWRDGMRTKFPLVRNRNLASPRIITNPCDVRNALTSWMKTLSLIEALLLNQSTARYSSSITSATKLKVPLNGQFFITSAESKNRHTEHNDDEMIKTNDAQRKQRLAKYSHFLLEYDGQNPSHNPVFQPLKSLLLFQFAWIEVWRCDVIIQY